MYEDYFDLKAKPFELVPNPEYLFHSRSHKKAINYLKYGLHERAGFILLTGEVGSGKTTILKNIITEVDDDVALSMLFNTRVSNKQVLAMINEDFGLNVTGKDKITLLRNLNDFLLDVHSQNKRAVVIIDEAQNLSVSALEEIRLLSNLEASDAKLLQIVMVGQPELKDTIACNELRQLRQRIGVHCQIDPLTRDETREYVYHRLDIAGNRNAIEWGDGTFDVLYKHSQGTPRLINVFCDFLLLASFGEGVKTLDVDFVNEVIADVSWDKHVEAQAGNETKLVTLTKSSLASRLGEYDRKMAALEGLLSHRDEVNMKLHGLEEVLLDVLQIQEDGFRRMEVALERTCHHLQMYLTGFVTKDNPNFETVSKEDRGEETGEKPIKGALGELFS